MKNTPNFYFLPHFLDEKNPFKRGLQITALILISTCISYAQSMEDLDEEAFQVKRIYDQCLTKGQCYYWLENLTSQVGPRLSGSPQSLAAIEWARQIMDTLGLDTVWLQPCTVPHWVRGEKELVRVIDSHASGTFELTALALGNSVGTGNNGITGEVIEVFSIDGLKALGRPQVEGKIVFFNRPFDKTQVNPFRGYGGAVDQRGIGPVEAAKLGAIASVVRSMTPATDHIPHTGATRFDPDGNNIPAVAISTADADKLGKLLEHETVRLYIRTTCQTLEPKQSYNVIGEINGSDRPDEIILVGGHLDSWDVGHGAHDDGAGCVQSLDVLYQLQKIGYRPRRTIRCVLFMNEENGLAGARAYAERAFENDVFHLAALESDSGGFTPRGFRCTAQPDVFEAYFQQLTAFWPVLAPYGLYLKPGGSGADITPLKPQGGLLIGFRTDPQRYFDLHHSAADVFEKVHQRELELGTAAMTSLVYLMDKYLEPERR